MSNCRGFRWMALALSAALVLGACGGGGGGTPTSDAGGADTSSVPPVSGDVTLSGSVYAGLTDGATVTIYAVDVQGNPIGDALGSASTDAQGHYTVTLSNVPSGPLLLVASGGSYVSEADGSTQPGVGVKVLVPAATAGATTAQLNPLTSAIAELALATMAQSSESASAAVQSATAKIKSLLGVNAMTSDPQTLAPDPTANAGDAWILAALAGALEELRLNSGFGPVALYEALLADISDGKLDGLHNQQTVQIGGSETLQSSLFTTQFSGAANAYGQANPSYAVATAGISAALQSSAQAVGVAIGSSGSIAPLQTQSAGTQIYFAARKDGLVKLDMSNPASPSAVEMTSINSGLLAGLGGSGTWSSVDGIVIDPTPIVTNGASKVYGIVYSYSSKTIYAINLSDGVIAGSLALPVTNRASFSGASAYVAGGIADGQRNLIWLATGDGLMGVDPSDLSKTAVLIPQPAGTYINENIGGDPAHDVVFSPDYKNKGLVVFNLAERKAYVTDSTAWTTLVTGSGFSAYFPYEELDGVALDSQYSIALITPEGGTDLALVRYATPSGATAATGVFAPVAVKAYSTPGYGGAAGSAIDPVTHTALLVGEGSGLAVGVLDDPNSANWQGFSRYVSDNDSSSYGFEPHDPHTVGVFNILGKAYGFLLQGSYSGNYQVAVLDLAAMLAAPASAGIWSSDPFADVNQVKLLSY